MGRRWLNAWDRMTWLLFIDRSTSKKTKIWPGGRNTMPWF